MIGWFSRTAERHLMQPRIFLRISALCFGLIFATQASIAGLGDWEPIEIVGLYYPPLGQQARIEGITVIRCGLQTDGSVGDVEFVYGHPIFKEATLGCARKWKFRQSTKATHPQRNFILVFNFRLKGSCHDAHCEQEFSVDLPNFVTVVSQIPSINPSASER